MAETLEELCREFIIEPSPDLLRINRIRYWINQGVSVNRATRRINESCRTRKCGGLSENEKTDILALADWLEAVVRER